VLAQLLCEGEVTVGKYSPTESTRKLQILSISRDSKTRSDFTLEGDRVQIGDTTKRVSRSEICVMVRNLLPAIQIGKTVFSAYEGDQLLDLLGITQLKTGSEKSDLFLNVLDPLSGATGLQGYTIKSFLGSSPTLFNAGLATNFTFSFEPRVSSMELKRLNGLPIREMCRELVDSGHILNLTTNHEIFGNNLSVLDSRMIEVVAQSIIAYYSMRCGRDGSLQSIAAHLAASNPLDVQNPEIFYHHKLKDLLEAATYGMVPSKAWNGKRSAPGGLLLVEPRGELTCIPAGHSDEHREYLLRSTKFETASRRRHKFGVITEDLSRFKLTLNLQIRYSRSR
jgi:hypothetical protein